MKLDEFVPTAALGILTCIMLPLAIAMLPFWLIGLLVGRWLDSRNSEEAA